MIGSAELAAGAWLLSPISLHKGWDRRHWALLVFPGAGVIAPALPSPVLPGLRFALFLPVFLVLGKARLWQHSVTFQQGSLLSPGLSASARYNGNVLFLHVSFSLLPGLKHREKGGEGGLPSG